MDIDRGGDPGALLLCWGGRTRFGTRGCPKACSSETSKTQEGDECSLGRSSGRFGGVNPCYDGSAGSDAVSAEAVRKGFGGVPEGSSASLSPEFSSWQSTSKASGDGPVRSYVGTSSSCQAISFHDTSTEGEDSRGRANRRSRRRRSCDARSGEPSCFGVSYKSANSGYDGIGSTSGGAVGSLRSSCRFKLDGIEFQRIFKKGKATVGACEQVLVFPVAGGPTCSQEIKAIGAPSCITERVSWQGPLHEVSHSTWRICRPAGIGVCGLATCPYSRLPAGWGCQRSSGGGSPFNQCCGPSLSGRKPLGCCIPDCTIGGTPSRGFQQPGHQYKPEDEGVLASGSPSLGINYVDLRERNGSYGFSTGRGFGGFFFNKVPEPRGGCSSKEEAAIPKEAEGWCRQVASYNTTGGGNRDDDSGGGPAAPHVLDLWCLGCRPASLNHVLFPGSFDDSASNGSHPSTELPCLGSEGLPCKADEAPVPFDPQAVSFDVDSKVDDCGSPSPKEGHEEDFAQGPNETLAEDPWVSFQEFSFVSCCRSLCQRVLHTRTPFAAFLKTTLHASRSSVQAPASALFPLPLPFEGCFDHIPPKCSSQKRRRIEFHRACHIIVCALNYTHADCSFPSLDLMRRRPSRVQQQAIDNLVRLTKAFGNSAGRFHVPKSGRRSIHLLAGLSDLCSFVTDHGLSSEPYHGGFPGRCNPGEPVSEERIKPDLSRAEELRPYRRLDPDRLKLHGRANWDPVPHLGDELRMPCLEPDLLVWTDKFDHDDLPDLDLESPDDTLKVARLWDINGLLVLKPRLVDQRLQPSCLRVFNNFKNEGTDRQIGDRRGRNQIERKMLGPSRSLPTGPLLANLELNPNSSTLSIDITDRKDYYHQMMTSASRSFTNQLWPPIPIRHLRDTKAYAEMTSRMISEKTKGREATGDFREEEKIRSSKSALTSGLPISLSMCASEQWHREISSE